VGAPAASADASCLAATGLTDIAAVPASGLAAALIRRGGASATGSFGDGVRSPKSGTAPPSMAALAGCSSGGCVWKRILSGGSASDGSWLKGRALDGRLLRGSWLGGSPSGAGGSAKGLPEAGSPRVEETVDGVSGGRACGCGRRGAPEAGLEAEAGPLASCGLADKSAVGGRDRTPIGVGTSSEATENGGGGR